MADEIEGLKTKIKDLEIALENERKRKGPMREKINEMSSEVVDSNPYRLVNCSLKVAPMELRIQANSNVIKEGLLGLFHLN